MRRGERGRVKALDRHKTISTEEGTYSSPVTSRGEAIGGGFENLNAIGPFFL